MGLNEVYGIVTSLRYQNILYQTLTILNIQTMPEQLNSAPSLQHAKKGLMEDDYFRVCRRLQIERIFAGSGIALCQHQTTIFISSTALF